MKYFISMLDDLFGQVTQNGQFFSYGVDKANYATMVLVRVKLVKMAYDSLAAASTIAIRYSAVRRQSSLKPGFVIIVIIIIFQNELMDQNFSSKSS